VVERGGMDRVDEMDEMDEMDGMDGMDNPALNDTEGVEFE